MFVPQVFVSGQANTSIIRRRRAPSHRGALGKWIKGPVTETTFRAVVQPIRTEDLDAEGGVQLRRRLRVYVAAPDALRAAFDDAEADSVAIDGDTYTVEQSESWPGSHCEARLLREA